MIRILVADSDRKIKGMIEAAAAECMPGAEVILCVDPAKAAAGAEEEPFDIAFIDADEAGLELGKKLREFADPANIIFMADGPEHAAEAFAMHASGYILKPVDADEIKAELCDLRYRTGRDDRGLRVQAFGNFEVFYDGKPLHFKYAKTKELLAYLIDRNCAVVDIGEIRATLWYDDEDRTSYIKQLRKDLVDTLKKVGEEDAIVIVRGGIGVVPGKVRCDYFDYLAGDERGISAYHGEYMQQYSWSEVTHGSLEASVNGER